MSASAGRAGDGTPRKLHWSEPGRPPAVAVNEPASPGPRWSRLPDGSPVLVSHPTLTRKSPTPGLVRGFDTVGARYLVTLDGESDPQWCQGFRVTARAAGASASPKP